MKKYIKNLYKALIGKSSSGQVDELLDALLLLTDKIGIYGIRIEKPISLWFGNGLQIRDGDGVFVTSGTNKIAKIILEKRI